MGSCAPIALPEAEVVSLSPGTLLELETYPYTCEICCEVFQREQNLLMHRRRRHSLPSKVQKRDAGLWRPRKKRVFVCPEPSCPHHDPSHGLASRTGIKKHYRRKHGGHRRWACARCSKAYAVLSDYKAHAKTCGTLAAGHFCCQHCGRVFTRVYRFVEHQFTCSAGRPQAGVGADGKEQNRKRYLGGERTAQSAGLVFLYIACQVTDMSI